MPDDRKRNRARVEAAEKQLAEFEQRAASMALIARQLVLDAHRLRDELRAVLGMEPTQPPAPLFADPSE